MYELGGVVACHQRTSGHELAVVIIKSVPLMLPHMTRTSRSHQHRITNGECMSPIPSWPTDSCNLVRAGGDAVYDLPMRMQESLTKLRGSVTHKKGRTWMSERTPWKERRHRQKWRSEREGNGLRAIGIHHLWAGNCQGKTKEARSSL